MMMCVGRCMPLCAAAAVAGVSFMWTIILSSLRGALDLTHHEEIAPTIEAIKATAVS